MKYIQAILVFAMAVALAGCVLSGKQPVVAATPVIPTATAAPAPAPAPPPGPLSIPQTHADLPALQPISPEAVASTEPPGQPPPPPPVTPRQSRRASNPPPSQSRTEVPAAAPAAVPVPVAAPPVTEPEPRPPIQEIVSPNELNRLKAQADDLKGQIRRRLDQVQHRRLTKEQRDSVDSIASFVKLSDEAERAGDMRKAFDLAERGAILAQGLPGAR